MYGKKKERLYVYDILKDPAVTYPMYYNVNKNLHEDEVFHDALRAVHMCDFSYYKPAVSGEDIFTTIFASGFVIYKEQYVVGYFGNKLMYLESSGWKGLHATEDIFKMENWLV